MSPSYHPLEPALLLRDVFFNPDVIYRVSFSFQLCTYRLLIFILFIIILLVIVILGSNG